MGLCNNFFPWAVFLFTAKAVQEIFFSNLPPTPPQKSQMALPLMDERGAQFQFVSRGMITDRIGRHEVLLQNYYKNYKFRKISKAKAVVSRLRNCQLLK